jgi:ATP-dependent DNA helicase RecG
MVQKKYRIFISSVQKELETERVAVAGAVSSDRVLSEWCEVVLFEKEPLSGRKVSKPYLECLAGCQVCVLILDRAYGQPRVPMSASHEEYRLAHKKGMPMLIFIRGHHDADRQPETQRFFTEIKKDGHTYRRFHDRVDLIPEIKRGLARVLYETFGANISQSVMDDNCKADKASAFEQQILTVSGDALDIGLAREWLQIGKLPAKAILNHLREKGLVRKGSEASEFKAMASGLLFLGKKPADVFPQCRVLVDAYSGTEPDPRPRDQVTLSEPASRVIEKVVDFVMRNTRHPIRVVGIRRVRLDEYPQEVIREAIVNAIAHRDYEDSARPIYVKLFSDRVEILSPGDLMRPLTIAKLIRGKFEPCSRNPTLAQYLGHLGLMEQRGSGVLRMKQAMLGHGLDSPTYGFRDGYFCVTLKGPANALGRLTVPDRDRDAPGLLEDRLTERQKKMAKLLAEGHPLTSGKCQEMFRVSNVTAVRDLAFLVEIGIAKQEGKGRSTRYIFKGENR